MKTAIKGIFCVLILIVILFSCSNDEGADLIIINGNIYTGEIDENYEAIAIKGQHIIGLGSNKDIKKLKNKETKEIDANGNFVMPGFIEGHGHFYGLGKSLQNLNFLKSKNWDDIVKMVEEKVKESKPGEWIEGRGWHQEKWNKIPDGHVHGYPFHQSLSDISPDNPVVLRHASGHGLFANKKAMELAGITKETGNPSGGEIVRNSEGEAIGVFEERAMQVINEVHQEYIKGLSADERKKKWYEAIDLAQKECLENGITSFQDAGSSFNDIKAYKQLAIDNKFDLRLWAMVRHSSEELKDRLDEVRMIDVGNGFFTCRAIKTELDGALGSFGAWLLDEYHDKKNFVGQNTTSVEEVKAIAELALENDMQLCVHAIGDKANREVLDLSEEIFKNNPDKSDLRWRIEHAQHLNVDDIPRFQELGMIASMQGVHCTSDAPFVEKRLGEQRARTGAYAWRALIDAGAIVTNGTDAPVEDVDPIASFYATVTRKRPDNGLEFFTEQEMTRIEALKSYTINCAYAAFEENIKGSLAVDKYADITILDKDLLKCTDEEILETNVLYTIVGGQVKYERSAIN